jgi:hypothetical protein
MKPISRRTFLKTSAAAAATLAFPSVCLGGWKKVQKVVIVRFGGGVRFAETFGDSRAPNLPYIAKGLLPGATLYTNLFNDGATDHVGGTLQILTGKPCHLKDMDRRSPKAPTIFEYYRQEKNPRRVPASKCVVVAHTALDVAYHRSLNPKFGSEFGGVVFSPRLLMYEHLYKVMENEQDTTSDVYRKAKDLRERLWLSEDFEHTEDPDRNAPAYAGDAGAAVTTALQKEKVPTVRTRAVGDELVMKFAESLMGTLKPDILMVNFAGPDIAHKGSFGDYLERIRMIDIFTAQLFNEFKKKWIKNGLFFVLPDCGRSLPGHGGGGFTSHRNGDEGCRHIWAIVAGAGVKKKVIDTPVSQFDIAPTIGEAMGFGTSEALGKPLPD